MGINLRSLNLYLGLLAACAGTWSPAWGQPKTGTAADFVPDNVAGLLSMKDLSGQAMEVYNSKAFQRLWQNPLIQEQLETLTEDPQFQQAQFLLAAPILQEVAAIFREGAQNEVMLYMGPGWTDFIRWYNLASWRMNFETFGAALDQDEPALAYAFVSAFEDAPAKKLPELMVGLKVTDTARVDRVLDMFVPLLKEAMKMSPIPVPLTEEKVGESTFYSIVLKASMLPVPEQLLINQLTQDERISEEQARKFVRWGMGQQISFSMGRYNDYLLFAIGADLEHLRAFGTGTSIAASPRFAPVAKYVDDKLLTVGWISKEYADAAQLPRKEIEKGLLTLLESIEDRLPENAVETFKSDIIKLAEIYEKAIATADMAYVCRRNKGAESFSYIGMDTEYYRFDKPVDLMKLRPKNAVMSVAWAASPGKERYAAFAEFVRILYQRGVMLAPMGLSEEQLPQLEAISKVVEPFGKQLDTIITTKILPAADAGQSMFTLDFSLQVSEVAGFNFGKPMPMPVISVVSTLNDGDTYTSGMGDIYGEIERLLPKLAAAVGAEFPPEFAIQRPQSEPVGSGNRFFYPIPVPLPEGIGPSVYVDKTKTIFGYSIPQLTELATASGGVMPTNPVIDFSAPSGAIAIIETAPVLDAVKKWADWGLNYDLAEGNLSEEQVKTYGKLIADGADFLGTWRGIYGRSYREGEGLMTHNWFHWEDVAE